MSACNIRFFKKPTFYFIQRKYLWPVVNNLFLKQPKEVLQSFRELAGDGRCDSLGHNAKYGTYSLIEVTTEKIIACVAAVSFPFPNGREGDENCERLRKRRSRGRG